MKISTLSIGDELVSGEVVDTNAAHIAARLRERSIRVQQHLLVGDSEPDIMDAIELLTDRSDAVIVTGGLGPTADDLTTRAAARVAGQQLVLHEEALQHAREFIKNTGGTFYAAEERQALLPAECAVIPNPSGTACGFIITWKGRFLIFLPGVPSEMKRMIEATVIPFLEERQLDRTTTLAKSFTLFGLPEAEIGRIISATLGPEGPDVAYRVRFPLVDVKLRGTGTRAETVEAILEQAVTAVRKSLGDWIVCEDGVSFDEEVARLLRGQGLTISLAESCTGGLIAKRLTDIAGSSAYFLEGSVVYSNTAKTRILNVPENLIEEQGAVSAAVAEAMARGARTAAGSDIALAVTGVAGPGASEEKPAGTVFIALADRNGCGVREFHFKGDRSQVRSLTAYTALDWLRRDLLSQ